MFVSELLKAPSRLHLIIKLRCFVLFDRRFVFQLGFVSNDHLMWEKTQPNAESTHKKHSCYIFSWKSCYAEKKARKQMSWCWQSTKCHWNRHTVFLHRRLEQTINEKTIRSLRIVTSLPEWFNWAWKRNRKISSARGRLNTNTPFHIDRSIFTFDDLDGACDLFFESRCVWTLLIALECIRLPTLIRAARFKSNLHNRSQWLAATAMFVPNLIKLHHAWDWNGWSWVELFMCRWGLRNSHLERKN